MRLTGYERCPVFSFVDVLLVCQRTGKELKQYVFGSNDWHNKELQKIVFHDEQNHMTLYMFSSSEQRKGHFCLGFILAYVSSLFRLDHQAYVGSSDVTAIAFLEEMWGHLREARGISLKARTV